MIINIMISRGVSVAVYWHTPQVQSHLSISAWQDYDLYLKSELRNEANFNCDFNLASNNHKNRVIE